MSAQAGDRQSSTVYDASSIGREKRDDSGAQIWLSERGLVGRHDRALGGAAQFFLALGCALARAAAFFQVVRSGYANDSMLFEHYRALLTVAH